MGGEGGVAAGAGEGSGAGVGFGVGVGRGVIGAISGLDNDAGGAFGAGAFGAGRLGAGVAGVPPGVGPGRGGVVGDTTGDGWGVGVRGSGCFVPGISLPGEGEAVSFFFTVGSEGFLEFATGSMKGGRKPPAGFDGAGVGLGGSFVPESFVASGVGEGMPPEPGGAGVGDFSGEIDADGSVGSGSGPKGFISWAPVRVIEGGPLGAAAASSLPGIALGVELSFFPCGSLGGDDHWLLPPVGGWESDSIFPLDVAALGEPGAPSVGEPGMVELLDESPAGLLGAGAGFFFSISDFFFLSDAGVPGTAGGVCGSVPGDDSSKLPDFP